MKHILIIIAMSVTLCSDIHAQGFNLMQDYGHPINHFKDLLVANDTIIGLGIGYPDSTNLTQSILLVMLDSNGGFLQKKMITDSLGGHLTISNTVNKIIKTSDGGYAMMGASIPRRNAIFYKLDASLNIEFTKEFTDSLMISNFEYMVLETKTGYILYGTVQKKSNLDIIGMLHHIDKAGNTIWRKEFNEGGINNYLFEVKPITDTTFIVSSIVDINPSLFYGYSILRIINIGGQVLNQWKSEVDSPEGEIIHVTPLEEGGFLAYGQHLHQRIQGYFSIASSFMKFDASLNLEWIRFWGRPTFSLGSLRMSETYRCPDGNYVTIGRTPTTPDDNNIFRTVGWFMKYSAEGDSIWSREVESPSEEFKAYGGEISAGGLLSSGSIVGGGYIRVEWAYYAWIVKLSENGCLDTIFVCTPASSVSPQPEKEELFKLFPNPGSGTVFWTSTVTEPVNVEIYNALGQWVTTRHNALPGISVEDLSPGIYTLRFSTMDGQLLALRMLSVVR